MRAKARELRGQGLDYKRIAAELGVSKSSVSLWVRDLPRPERLSYEECRKRQDAAVAAYWTAGRARREAARNSDRLVFRMSIHESADVAAAQAFWLAITTADPAQFRRPSLKRHNPKTVRSNTGESYHGCLRIDVLGSATLYREVEGWCEAIMATPDAIRTYTLDQS